MTNTRMKVESKYPFNFTLSGERFVLSLNYNGRNSFFLVNATKIYEFKAKESEVKDCSHCF